MSRESLSEFVAMSWENYFDDVEHSPIPSALGNDENFDFSMGPKI